MENSKDPKKKKTLYEILKNIDRRIIYTMVFVCIIIPLLMPLGLPIRPSQTVEDIYTKIDRLPSGSKVVLSFDYDPGSEAEVHPMAIALIQHCWSKNLKIVAPALWPAGVTQASLAFEEVRKDEKFKGKQEGVDYVNLGYVAGPTLGLTQITMLCTDIKKARPEDVNRTPVDDYEKLPIMRGVKNVTRPGVQLVVSLSAGDPGVPAWVEIANSRYGVDVASGSTAVQAPQFYPYIQSKQLFGFMGGLRGAAEYEALLKKNKIVEKPGKGTIGMEAQSFAHVLIMLLIVIANIMYFIELRQNKR